LVPSTKFTLPVDLEGACCIRSDNRAAINEVACKIEGFILRQVHPQRAVIRSADEGLFSVLAVGN
jgi:hypothetical protein